MLLTFSQFGRGVPALVLGLLVPFGRAQSVPLHSGSPLAQVFDEREILGSPQTLAIAADPRGLIYLATASGLAEYDGVSWRAITGGPEAFVHGVEVDGAGRVWYAGYNAFGYLAPDAHGILSVRPLQDRLTVADRKVGHVLRMATQGDRAYFVTNGVRTFVISADSTGKLLIARPPEGERCQFVFFDGQVAEVMTTRAVYRIAGDRLVPVPEQRFLAGLGVLSVWPRQAGGAWLVTRRGLWRWEGNRARPTSREVADLIGESFLLCGLPLPDGTFALGTDGKGVLVVDAGGRILAQHNALGGLGVTGDTITTLALDAEGGLWLGHSGGATRIQIGTPALLHNLAGGVQGRVNTIAFHRGRLYVATDVGVFARDSSTGRFDEVANGGRRVWGLISLPGGLMAGGNDLRLIRNDGAVEMIESQHLEFRTTLPLANDPSRMAATTGPAGDLRLYHETDGHWKFEGVVPSVHGALIPIFQDREGWLWGRSANVDIVRLDWRGGVRRDAPLEAVGPASGLPDLAAHPLITSLFLMEGEAEVASARGYWRHDPASDRFVPETRIAGLDAARWPRAVPLSDGSLWLVPQGASDQAAVARVAGPHAWRVQLMPYSGLEPIRVRAALDDPAEHLIWLGYEGLASLDPDWAGSAKPPPAARIRSVTDAQDQTIWGGAGLPGKMVLTPGENSLHFAFAALILRPDAYGKRSGEYRTRLEGLEAHWSDWTSRPQRDYSNLAPGDYSFRVQARDHEVEGPVEAFDFVILPPVYRTWWATLLEMLLAVAAVLGIVGLRTRQLRRSTAKLETVVAERTAELEQQNVELARLHRLELDAKIAARIGEEKARLETLRYQLNPHFLFNTLAAISSAVPPGPSRVRTMVERLADFCRMTLHRPDDTDWTTLGEELRLLNAFVDIERSRWGDLLDVTIECAPELAAERLPQFLILPLLENALKYGRVTSPERVGIRIRARREFDRLVLEVDNTGEWVDPKDRKLIASLGIGHENLRERLARYYPNRHDFTVRFEAGWVRARLTLDR